MRPIRTKIIIDKDEGRAKKSKINQHKIKQWKEREERKIKNNENKEKLDKLEKVEGKLRKVKKKNRIIE